MASAGPGGGGGDSLSQSYYDNSAKFNPTTAVVIIVLIAGCFVLAFVSVVVRRCMQGDMPQSGVGPQSGTYTAKTRGLQKADVDALPLVHSTDLVEKDHDHECPVCLMEFEPEEALRLLPACKHVFHQECIDAWFDSHSTCPLCRASLVGGDAGKPESAVPAVDAVDTIVEVSENGDYSDAEVHGGAAQTLSQDSRAAMGPVISREDERSSARGPLFRNSESFKRAARGVAAQESAATAAEDEKNSSFRKPAATTDSIRRSPSLGADLISLRNLLMRGDQNANPTDPSSNSSRWFARATSLELANRDRAVQNEYSLEPSQDDWVTIDLQSGKPAAEAARISGESSSGSLAPARSWSDRFSLTRLKSLKGMANLSRSTSDVSSRHSPQDLPI